ncbi:hypothetical protein KI809_15255 [Geobacter pelophilus]|uniref:Uncharacterized protein n=1 Tax=Geoanaerobacter pelophilus TaxID=60036 RepID=A0AAW4LET2_9BACT|nr:hypothetical protein [Geoanaerobacter pelophilus]MBT0665666.1 hypothetical protein [Geoanaerobacter pelophilus]
MPDQILIYLIVALNAICQLMLIWRQKFAPGVKWRYCCLAIAIPVVIMVSMRLFIAGGLIHGRVADQTTFERYLTTIASILLLAGPWLVTITTLFTRKRQSMVTIATTE